jgi:ATP-dependent RNA helicase DeaD
MSSFSEFELQPATYAMLAKMEISEPTPIQEQAIPVLLAGKDVVGRSATGSGKTLAYGIPLVERVSRKMRVPQLLVLLPTRELAIQVHSVLDKLASGRRIFTALLVGGRTYGRQISALQSGAQIVIGTPGRVKDHIDRGTLVLSQLRMCVLDEADQMLDSGFGPDIEEILTNTPETRQMALFSATIPAWVEKIQQKFLHDPVKLDVAPPTGTLSTIEQIAYQIPSSKKMEALCTLLHAVNGESTLIFGKTKHGVEKLGEELNKLGYTVGTLHGDKSQRAREQVLTAFRKGQVQTLLATNVAARGLDIQGIAQVINYELPESSDLFTHRIGRTGRMGRQGKAITLLIPSDVPKWKRMARNLGQTVTLQKLVINEDALTTPPPVREVVIVEQQSESEDTQVAAKQERDSTQKGTFGRQNRRKERVVTGTEARAWEEEDLYLPERPATERPRRERDAGRPYNGGKFADRRKSRAFGGDMPERRNDRRKFQPVGSTRRASVSNRSDKRARYSRYA